jgi:hypothetical protein
MAADTRFQMQTNPLVVLDTQTGALWKAESDGKGGYVMVPIRYLSYDKSTSTPTPPLPEYRK